MYTLYYVPGACSLATQVVIHELGETVNIINKHHVEDFKRVNPVGTVPVLIDNSAANGQENIRREGAAVMLYLLNKHPNILLPDEEAGREQAIQNIMFANATMHPAYGRLFFIAQTITDEQAKHAAFEAAASAINDLWQVVEQQLAEQAFLGGEHPSAADIMLSVYSRWGASFPVDINLGQNTRNMVETVQSRPSFQRALRNEELQSAA